MWGGDISGPLNAVIWQRGDSEVSWTSSKAVEDLEIRGRNRISYRFITRWLHCQHAEWNIYRLRHGKRTFLKWMLGAAKGAINAISVAVMPQWTFEHRVFAYDSFLKIGESIIETQQLFRCRFTIGRHENIPSRSTTLRWVASF